MHNERKCTQHLLFAINRRILLHDDEWCGSSCVGGGDCSIVSIFKIDEINRRFVFVYDIYIQLHVALLNVVGNGCYDDEWWVINDAINDAHQ